MTFEEYGKPISFIGSNKYTKTMSLMGIELLYLEIITNNEAFIDNHPMESKNRSLVNKLFEICQIT